MMEGRHGAQSGVQAHVTKESIRQLGNRSIVSFKWNTEPKVIKIVDPLLCDRFY